MGQLLRESANTIGVIGVILILIAYVLLQINKISSFSISYSLLNLVGACLILVSLYFYWNLASGVIEIAWVIISVYGVINAFRHSCKCSQKTENL